MTQDRTDDRLQIVEEQLHVGKRVIETDRVRVRTIVDEQAVTIEDQVARGVFRIEHVAMDREIASAPPPREEGDTTIVSIVEERAEIVKRLFLVEEVHIHRDSIVEAVAIPATVRTMRAVVEHDAPNSGEK